MNGSELAEALCGAGVLRGSGVPCSYFGSLWSALNAVPGMTYVPAPNEGAAVGLAAGWALTGHLPFVVMQSSGVPNALNPLCTLTAPYRLPLLMIVSVRGRKRGDEIHHTIEGRSVAGWLRTAGASVHLLPRTCATMHRGITAAAQRLRRQPGIQAFLVDHRHFATPDSNGALNEEQPGLPSRADVVAAVCACAHDRAIITTTGLTSRELFRQSDQPSHFYMQGSMGHAAAIAGAIVREGRPAVILDGDGAVLMHLGGMALLGAAKAASVVHVILVNQVYETTGSQTTAAPDVRFADVALAVGYDRVAVAKSVARCEECLTEFLGQPNASCLVVHTAKGPPDAHLPRISQTLSHAGNATRFAQWHASPWRSE